MSHASLPNILISMQRLTVAALCALALSPTASAQQGSTTYTYDAQGNMTSARKPLSRFNGYVYDSLHRLKQYSDPNDAFSSITYDKRDQIASIRDKRGKVTTYTIDGLGNQTREVSPDRGTINQTFDEAGNLKTRTDARGKTTTYTYDVLNRLSKAAFHDGTNLTYIYDQGANGVDRLTGIHFPVGSGFGSTTYTYDPYGNVETKRQNVNGVVHMVRYGWDAETGLLMSITYPSGRVLTLNYDAAGHVHSLQVGSANLLTNISYAPFGPAKSWTWGNSVAYTRQFDLDGRISNLQLGPNGRRILTYDDANRITSINHPSIAAHNQTVGYDKIDHVTSWNQNTNSRDYNYDANDNRTSLTVGSSNYPYTRSTTSNQLIQTAGPLPVRNFQYDAAGNVISDGQRAFSYNDRGRLSRVTIGTQSVSYTYDGLGQRVRKWGSSVPSGGNHYVYDEAGQLLGVYNSAGGPIQEFVYLNGVPVAILNGVASNPVVYYIYSDQVGRPWVITDILNQVVWRWDTSPFGELLPEQNPTGLGNFVTNLRFLGQYYDSESGLHYNYFRDYDPQTGRYMQPDPIGLEGGLNTYTYVVGNPISGVDPFGLDTLVYKGGFLTHYDSKGKVVGSYPATSGVSGVTNPSIRDRGPIPEGRYTVNPNEISRAGFFRRFLGDWGEFRVPTHADSGTQTFGRSGFFIHGGKDPGSAGCIDVGRADKTFFPRLQRVNEPVPLIVVN